MGKYNSSITRVRPVFGWLRDNADPTTWPRELLLLVKDFGIPHRDPGELVKGGLFFDPEIAVPPMPARLLWLLDNVGSTTSAGSKKETKRLGEIPQHRSLSGFKQVLRSGMVPYRQREKRGPGPPNATLFLEGPTFGDAVAICKKAVIWIEGKRTDAISKSTKWDEHRDQIARNLEAAWQLAGCPHEEGVAQGVERDVRVLVCYENKLNKKLIKKYRTGKMRDAWPHLDEETQRFLSVRLGTLRWIDIRNHFKGMGSVPELGDVSS